MLFLDRGSPHKAKRTRALANAMNIEMRFLPTACPELNPLEGIWREIKGSVMCNESTPDLQKSLERAFDHIEWMNGTDRLKCSGVMSGKFWMAT